MKNKVLKRAVAAILALQLAVTGFGGIPAAEAADRVTPVEGVNKGEEDYTKLYSTSGSAAAGEVKSAEIKVENNRKNTYFLFSTTEETTISVAYKREGTSGDPYVTSFKTVKTQNGNVGYIFDALQEFTYTLNYQFDKATNYELIVFQSVASISKDYINLTKGFSKTLKIKNADGKVKWATSNKKVATVKNGKVTAKKKGKCVISASGVDSKGFYFLLICVVNVKNNVYTNTKITKSDVESGDSMGNVYKVSYDKKGNLVVKTRLVNKSGHNYSKLSNIKIVVKDSQNKVVTSYKVGTKSVSVKNGSVKDMTFTIPKSKVKQKKDLAGGSASFSGTGVYYVYH